MLHIVQPMSMIVRVAPTHSVLPRFQSFGANPLQTPLHLRVFGRNVQVVSSCCVDLWGTCGGLESNSSPLVSWVVMVDLGFVGLQLYGDCWWFMLAYSLHWHMHIVPSIVVVVVALTQWSHPPPQTHQVILVLWICIFLSTCFSFYVVFIQHGYHLHYRTFVMIFFLDFVGDVVGPLMCIPLGIMCLYQCQQIQSLRQLHPTLIFCYKKSSTFDYMLSLGVAKVANWGFFCGV